MDKNIRISTIIPVYNAEKYIERCLDSVLSQGLDGLEIICVDDGSTDSSLAIINKYSASYDCLKVIRQPNSHAGVARNAGMDVAVGEFIHFLDADDYLFPNVYEKMYRMAKDNDLDFLKIKAKAFSADDGKELEEQPVHYTMGFMKKDDYGKVVSLESFTTGLVELQNVTPWSGLYGREFLIKNHIRFNNLVCVNDRSFYIQVILQAGRIMFMDLFAVWYQVGNRKSLMGVRGDYFNCHFKSYKEIESLTTNCDKELRKRIMTVELLDIYVWYKKLSEEQWSRLKYDLFRFFSEFDWSNVNRCQWMYEMMEDINGILNEYYNVDIIDVSNINEACKKKDNLYLYGFGMMGRKLVSLLKSMGVRPRCIIVSNSEDENSFDGLEVKTIQNISFPAEKNSVTVFLAAKSIYHLQMLRNLNKYGINNTISISDTQFEEL